VARTVATTHLLDRIAGHYGLSVVETPVGFKYIGCALREQGAFLGGEESGGISTSSHIPEKDGIFAALLFLEMLAKTGEKAAELLAGIQSRFGPVYSERLGFRIAPQEKETILSAMQEWQPKELVGVPVASVNRIDGVKTVLANGSWCLIRPSGTEPVFRLYVEAGSGEEKKQLQKEIKETFFAHVREE
jgi:phosphomannomutase